MRNKRGCKGQPLDWGCAAAFPSSRRRRRRIFRILAAAQGSSNIQIARELDINVDTVRLWRDRWANWQEFDQEESLQQTVSLAQCLQDASRPGAAPRFTAEQRAQMAALSCEAPAKTGRPISHWTGGKRGNFRSLDDLRDQMLAFIEYYHRTMVNPIKWTYTGLS